MENNNENLSQSQKDLITFGEGLLKSADAMVVHYTKEALSKLVVAMIRLSILNIVISTIVTITVGTVITCILR